MIATTLRGALENYTLYRDLSSETMAWYRRAVSVYCGWAGHDVQLSEFNGEQISRMLADKQKAGRSPHYVKSLRNGLVALLREIRGNAPVERVRSIKTPPLDPEAWQPAEVEKLLAACAPMPEASRWRWRLIIACGYYSGLDRCDLERIEQANIDARGTLICRRRKTGALVIVQVPMDLLAEIRERCQRKGPILRMGVSKEWFRKTFAGVVKRSGLYGTFKKLRKSAGSLVEQHSPGKGHKHLGNTRAIFERHYEARRLTRSEPTMPPLIKFPP